MYDVNVNEFDHNEKISVWKNYKHNVFNPKQDFIDCAIKKSPTEYVPILSFSEFAL